MCQQILSPEHMGIIIGDKSHKISDIDKNIEFTVVNFSL